MIGKGHESNWVHGDKDMYEMEQWDSDSCIIYSVLFGDWNEACWIAISQQTLRYMLRIYG